MASTFGMISPTPPDGATLNVGQPYTFHLAIIVDEAGAVTDDVHPLVTAGAASRDPDQAQTIGDTGSGEASSADWTITPTAAGSLTIECVVEGQNLTVAGGAGEGSRTYTLRANAPQTRLSLGLGMGL